MKRTLITKAWIALLLGTLISTAAMAQNAPGPRGRGQAAPPKSNEQREARREQCPNSGVCPAPDQCPGPGLGDGARVRRGQSGSNGAGPRGQGQRRGLRDGTGPRSQNGTCPNLPVPPQS